MTISIQKQLEYNFTLKSSKKRDCQKNVATSTTATTSASTILMIPSPLIVPTGVKMRYDEDKVHIVVEYMTVLLKRLNLKEEIKLI